MRMCVDHWQLNAHSILYAYPSHAFTISWNAYETLASSLRWISRPDIGKSPWRKVAENARRSHCPVVGFSTGTSCLLGFIPPQQHSNELWILSSDPTWNPTPSLVWMASSSSGRRGKMTLTPTAVSPKAMTRTYPTAARLHNEARLGGARRTRLIHTPGQHRLRVYPTTFTEWQHIGNGAPLQRAKAEANQALKHYGGDAAEGPEDSEPESGVSSHRDALLQSNAAHAREDDPLHRPGPVPGAGGIVGDGPWRRGPGPPTLFQARITRNRSPSESAWTHRRY